MNPEIMQIIQQLMQQGKMGQPFSPAMPHPILQPFAGGQQQQPPPPPHLAHQQQVHDAYGMAHTLANWIAQTRKRG